MAPTWLLQHDLRAPTFGTPLPVVYREALDMAAWADRHQCPRVVISEHHASADSYLPSPFVFAGALAARTEQMRIMVAALVLTLRDPIATAEDAAVVDQLSGGRLELVVVPGYVREEFELFGVAFDDRGRIFEEKLARFLAALSGVDLAGQDQSGVDLAGQDQADEPPAATVSSGRAARSVPLQITPGPVQLPRPLVIMGGTSPRRAARFGDAFLPPVPDPLLATRYRRACQELGKGDGLYLRPGGPLAVFVTTDPEAAWAELAPHIAHEANAYAGWSSPTGAASPYHPTSGLDELRKRDDYAIVTPEECVALAQRLGDDTALRLKPLLAGCNPEIGWRSLELFVNKVLPRLDAKPEATVTSQPSA